MKTNQSSPVVSACAACVLAASMNPAGAAVTSLFTSGFEGNTGATVLSGNTDNISGSSTLSIQDWTTHATVTSISGLTALSTNGGGFVRLQNGAATYANANVVYISRNHNLDTNPQRGFSLSFTISAPWTLDELIVRTRHTNNSGTQAQVGASDLHYRFTGGTIETPVTGSLNQVYTAELTGYTPVVFDLNDTPLGAGTYTLQIFQQGLTGVGGAYATFDGITLNAVPEPSAVVLGGLSLGGLLVRRRR